MGETRISNDREDTKRMNWFLVRDPVGKWSWVGLCYKCSVIISAGFMSED